MPDLAIIVPTRGRPENIRKVISAWDFTNAWDHADLVLAVDGDDPEYRRYVDLYAEHFHPDTDQPLFWANVQEEWTPMVHKLDRVARDLARAYFAIGFAGDDHLPQTIGWAERYLTVLREMGTGMVYGDDGYQGRKLSTEWAVTADVVRALGRMVPAPVEHMYCDNAMMDLFNGAGALRHLPEVRIEHMHPIVGKAETDDQYKRVNHRDQFSKDRRAYEQWKTRLDGLFSQVPVIRALRPGMPEFRVDPVKPVASRPPTPRTRGVIRRSGPSKRRVDVARFPFSKEFKEVRGATPDEIGMTLADFATQVPADQEIVELGVFQGRTALIMAWGAAQGHGAHVTGIDPWDLPGNVYDPPFTDEQSKAWAHYRIRELGYSDKINLVQGFSQDLAPHWNHDGQAKKVGLLYVDGDHTKEGARRDIEVWAPHLAPGAVIAVDDYGHPDWPGVGQAVDELVAEGFLQPIELYHDRLAVTRLTDVIERTDPIPAVKAITSEGVSPTPWTPDDDEEFDLPTTDPDLEAKLRRADPEGVAALEKSAERLTRNSQVQEKELSDLEAEWRRVDPEGVAALEKSAERSTCNSQVQERELPGLAGTPIEDLNLVNLKALAKVRGIVLGSRKDKRSEIIEALRAGK